MECPMDESQAIALVRAYVNEKYPAYPTSDLVAVAFASGWTVFAKVDATDIESLWIGQTIFLIGKNGVILESSSSLPPGRAEDEFTARYGIE